MSRIALKYEMELENLVDQAGLYNVLAALVTICESKADHLRSTWQDEGAARAWEQAGDHVLSAAERCRKFF